MSTNNRIGRNPFDKKPKAFEASQIQKPTQSSEPVLKLSDKKVEAEEQIIGELIDLPEESWQPLSMVPSQFIKHFFLSLL